VAQFSVHEWALGFQFVAVGQFFQPLSNGQDRSVNVSPPPSLKVF
jgi:hypothetical protein